MDTLGLQSLQMRMGAEATSRQTGHSNSFSFAAILLSMYSSSCMLGFVFLMKKRLCSLLASFEDLGGSSILRASIS